MIAALEAMIKVLALEAYEIDRRSSISCYVTLYYVVDGDCLVAKGWDTTVPGAIAVAVEAMEARKAEG